MKSLAVYSAGPLETGPASPARNFRIACLIAEDLRRVGREHGVHVAVVLPHAMLAVDVVTPRPREEWLADCLAWVERADALFRFGGASEGADRETARAVEKGVPVLRGIGAFSDWLTTVARPAGQPSLYSRPEHVALGVDPNAHGPDCGCPDLKRG